MDEGLRLLTTYGAAIAAIGAAMAFGWSVIQFFLVRGREAKSREFETFHLLIEKLVEHPKDSTLKMDRQCAILYELRFFPRYYPFTRRTLRGLKEHWSFPTPNVRLIEEIDITLGHIDAHFNVTWRRLIRGLGLSPPVER